MTITIKLVTDNAAFEDKEAEVARIFGRWAAIYKHHGTWNCHTTRLQRESGRYSDDEGQMTRREAMSSMGVR